MESRGGKPRKGWCVYCRRECPSILHARTARTECNERSIVGLWRGGKQCRGMWGDRGEDTALRAEGATLEERRRGK